MAEHVIRLPDVGEGVAEAELVQWHVKVGDLIREDDLLASVMTDKATVEIPSPVSGTVVSLNGKIGEKLAVGSDLVVLETEAGAAPAPHPDPLPAPGRAVRGMIHYDAEHARRNRCNSMLAECRGTEGAEHAICR